MEEYIRFFSKSFIDRCNEQNFSPLWYKKYGILSLEEDNSIIYDRIRYNRKNDNRYKKAIIEGHIFDMNDKIGVLTYFEKCSPEIIGKMPQWYRFHYSNGDYIGVPYLLIYRKKDIIEFWMKGGEIVESDVYYILYGYVEYLKKEISSCKKKFNKRKFYFDGSRSSMINCITYYMNVKYGNKKVWNAS